jgi:amino acid transporter
VANSVAAVSGEKLLPKVGLWGAISANVLNMIGVGPFITIPLALAAMGGPQALLGWILGAFIAFADGMVWAELGSAMPYSGGPYHYLMEAFGPKRAGQLFSFLYLWQAIVLGPFLIASGAVGFAQYAGYLTPWLHLPALTANTSIALAAVVCLINTALLYRNIQSIARLSIVMTVIVLGSTIWIIVVGMTHFNPHVVFDFPPNAFHINHGFIIGLGSAMLISIYDYAGYNNSCLIGDEIIAPKKVIPRSILISIVLIAVIYLVMNISIISVVPWREAMNSQAIVSDFMHHIYGNWAAVFITVLILIASFGSVYAILLGLSRIPYAAAVDGHFFSIFARLHKKGLFPYISLIALGVASALACLISLGDLITVVVVSQTLLQAVLVCIAAILLRRQKRGPTDSFKMPLYPLPALISLLGSAYIVYTSDLKFVVYAFLFLLLGIAIFLFRAKQKSSWPFAPSA